MQLWHAPPYMQGGDVHGAWYVKSPSSLLLSGSRLPRSRAPGPPLFDPAVDDRQREQRERRGAEQAADDHHGQRRWTSDPGPVANAMGIRLKIAMLAVMSTARSRVSHPRITASATDAPSARSCEM